MASGSARLSALLSALREAEAALAAGASPEEVRALLRPHDERLRDWYTQPGALSDGDRKHLRTLLRENELLARSVKRLELDVQVLLDVIERGAGLGGDDAPAQGG